MRMNSIFDLAKLNLDKDSLIGVGAVIAKYAEESDKLPQININTIPKGGNVLSMVVNNNIHVLEDMQDNSIYIVFVSNTNSYVNGSKSLSVDNWYDLLDTKTTESNLLDYLNKKNINFG